MAADALRLPNWYTRAMGEMPVPLAGFLGSLVAGLGTGLGALPVFIRTRWSIAAHAIMLSGAAGIMLGATVFSLLLPALELASVRSGSLGASLSVATGVVAGAAAIWLLHSAVPHEHFVKGPEGARPTIHLGRNWLFILAITLHNFPEGLSVGVAWGPGASTGAAMTLGILLQNLPEGLAVAAALVGDGFSRARAFALALGTGLVEPVGGLVGALAASVSEVVLPWVLAGAGGAMLFVISGEIIPETHREGRERGATLALVVGFVGMMILTAALA